MTYLVSLYSTSKNPELKGTITKGYFNAESAQDAADIARDSFPNYEVFEVCLCCQDWK